MYRKPTDFSRCDTMAIKKKNSNEDVTTNEVVVMERNHDHKPRIRDADILNMDYGFDDKIEVATKAR